MSKLVLDLKDPEVKISLLMMFILYETRNSPVVWMMKYRKLHPLLAWYYAWKARRKTKRFINFMEGLSDNGVVAFCVQTCHSTEIATDTIHTDQNNQTIH